MAGETFGPYRLEALLGRGGMGEVHRAFDTTKKRTVALKRLHPHLADDGEFQARFRREAEVAARLTEPHIIPIHDYGEIDGQLFIDMRLVDGLDLRGLLQRSGPLSATRAVGILTQIASALAAAHTEGLIHRDVKPPNVLIVGANQTPDAGENGEDYAYLVDFGIAHSSAATSMTATGSTVGTLAYMAPERFLGRTVDHRVDIYALGCMLYETLTGQRAFLGEGSAELMYKHLTIPPPVPSQLRPDLPSSLDRVVAWAMAKNPDERYQTATEFASSARQAITNPRQLRVSTAPPPEPTPPPQPTLVTPPANDAPTAAEPPAEEGVIVDGRRDTPLVAQNDRPGGVGTRPATLPPQPVVPSPAPEVGPAPGPAERQPARRKRRRGLTILVATFAVLILLLATAAITVSSVHDRYLSPIMAVGPGNVVHVGWNDMYPTTISDFDDNHVASVAATDGRSIGNPISVGWLMSGMAVAPNGSTLYAVTRRGLVVASTKDRNITTTVPDTRVPGAPGVQGRRMLAVSPDGGRLYRNRPDLRRIDVLDTATLTAARSPIQLAAARGMVISPDGTRLYAATLDGIVMIDTSTGATIGNLIPITDGYVDDLAISRDGRKLAILTSPRRPGSTATLVVIDTASAAVVLSQAMDPAYTTFALAISPDGARAYLTQLSGQTQPFGGTVVVIDTATGARIGEPLRPAAAEDHPVGLALNADGSLLFVTVATGPSPGWMDVGMFDTVGPVQSASLMVIDTATMKPTGPMSPLGT